VKVSKIVKIALSASRGLDPHLAIKLSSPGAGFLLIERAKLNPPVSCNKLASNRKDWIKRVEMSLSLSLRVGNEGETKARKNGSIDSQSSLKYKQIDSVTAGACDANKWMLVNQINQNIIHVKSWVISDINKVDCQLISKFQES
jgi:hypothetical protein